MPSLGVVSFLNARPLIAGLAAAGDLQLAFDVPARLPAMLDAGAVDAALVPLIDILRRPGEYSLISDGCIACDGETMTVRVFAQSPPDRIERLCVDGDSHTSVVLARLLWRELYGRTLDIVPFDARQGGDAPDAVLLIGDKVIDPRRAGYAYEIDLGGAWRQATGLPFVFAAWAVRTQRISGDPTSRGPQSARTSGPSAAPASLCDLGRRLCAARDIGVARAAEIAREQGPSLGWPVELAERYLTRCLRFRLDERAQAGAERFAELCRSAEIVPPAATFDWTWLQRSASAAAVD